MSKQYNILVGSGGGSLGVQELGYLVELEKEYGKPIYNLFDCYVGTSTFGIISAALASKTCSAEYLLNDLYLKKMKQLFKKNFLLGGTAKALYNRKNLDKEVDSIFKNILLKDLTKGLCITSTRKEDGLTHFFKEYKEKYNREFVREIVKRTYSAPVYFDPYKCKVNNEDLDGTWLDGGTGIDNFPIMEAILEGLYFREQTNIKIFAVGAGTSYSYNKSWTENVTPNAVTGALNTFKIGRFQSEQRQINTGSILCDFLKKTKADVNYSFMLVDEEIPEKMSSLDNTNMKELNWLTNRAKDKAIKEMPDIKKFLNF